MIPIHYETENLKNLPKLYHRFSELSKNVAALYNFAASQEKEEILRNVFSELILAQKTLNFQCKNSFKALEERFLPTCESIPRR